MRAARILPNESTILLNISGDESDVIGRFSGSTRTKIRKADRSGFTARRVEATEANCRIMYSLLRETSEGRFQLRPYEYYRGFWQTFEKTGRGQLVLGYADSEPIAGMFGTVFGHTSGYKDGASTRRLRLPVGAMYRMQWELILWAREHGATVHDLIGTPPSDRLDDVTHPLYGVGQYKLRLSKAVTDYVGVWDLALRAGPARVWYRWGEPVARRLSLKFHKDPYY
ncbi:lipid II:glycine glycyltransferase FemX [Leucobacter viscericola]|uniref:lipid II:glycine glycyltransferase FemX n=1 Tax=Leucobacter viscericola TaxID=2714935 RepID=UPI001FCA6D3F|nr:GNAT family N-acetyltransferase [Leucobacter viscericola]